MAFDLLLIALAIALDPLPLTAFILLLTTTRGARTGAGFVIGWLVSLGGVVALTLVLTGGQPVRAGTVPSEAGLAVRAAIGVGLLAFAWSRHRASGRPQKQPAWMARLDQVGVPSAAVLACLLQPWGLIAAGCATVMQADLDKASSTAAIVGFCLVAAASYVLMEAYVVIAPEASRWRLENLRKWLDAHRDPAVVALSLALGILLIARSAYLLAA